MEVKKVQDCYIVETYSEEEERNFWDFLAGKNPTQEKILPRPVVRDKNGKLAKDYTSRDWHLKLQE